MDLELWAYAIAAVGSIAALWLEIRERRGLDERVAVLEALINALPDVHQHGERLAALEAWRDPWRSEPQPQPQTDEKRCRGCGRFRKRDD